MLLRLRALICRLLWQLPNCDAVYDEEGRHPTPSRTVRARASIEMSA